MKPALVSPSRDAEVQRTDAPHPVRMVLEACVNHPAPVGLDDSHCVARSSFRSGRTVTRVAECCTQLGRRAAPELGCCAIGGGDAGDAERGVLHSVGDQHRGAWGAEPSTAVAEVCGRHGGRVRRRNTAGDLALHARAAFCTVYRRCGFAAQRTGIVGQDRFIRRQSRTHRRPGACRLCTVSIGAARPGRVQCRRAGTCRRSAAGPRYPPGGDASADRAPIPPEHAGPGRSAVRS